jgi:hypothetical protein
MNQGKIRITYEDLQDPRVDDIIRRQAEETEMRSSVLIGSDLEGSKTSLIHKSWFNLLIAGLVGAFIAWMLIEPIFEDEITDEGASLFQGFLLFMLVGGFVGLFIGAMEGILAKNTSRAIRGGMIGFGVGFGGGLVSTFIAQLIFGILLMLGFAMLGEGALTDPANNVQGFVLFMVARSLGWAVAGMTMGLGPGIALKSKKLARNGFIGGMIGGMIGGLLFDPICYVVSGGTLESGGEASRAVGLALIGAVAGLMIGLVEMLTKDAWLLMIDGPLKGKQFIVYKNPTIIGSSPRSEIYLFKDLEIESSHARITSARDMYEIEDLETQAGTLVNGQKIKRQQLKHGDIIQIGSTKFIYTEKDKKKKT